MGLRMRIFNVVSCFFSFRAIAAVAAACLLTVCLSFAASAQAPAPAAADPTLKADPEVVKCIAKGHELLNKMQIDEALKEFQSCVQKFPESVLARYWLGVAYFSNREKDKAINELKEAVRLEPKNLPAMAMLGRAYSFDEKTLAVAEELLNRVLNVCPNFDDARFDLARIYAQKGEIDKALPLFFLLFEGEARFALYHTEMGKIFMAGGREKEARSEFERALAIMPGFEPAKKFLADLDKKPGSGTPSPTPSPTPPATRPPATSGK
ncbi:MAG: tetratricopeptide repeat protein [Desulfomonile sp.]|nr:tetratricopeptide repeat protein [Desulfomonile sp.]